MSEQLIILLLIVLLAYWHRDRWLYFIAGFSLILYSFDLFNLQVFLVIVGVYCFPKALLDRNKKGEG